MLKLKRVEPSIITRHVNDYICLGGMGLMNGLDYSSKADFYKIEAVSDDGIHCKAYRARKGCYLPTHNFNQECLIASQAEYKNIPSPGW